MIKLIVERDRPPTFNLANDHEVARHARISVNAIAELAGRRLCVSRLRLRQNRASWIK